MTLSLQSIVIHHFILRGLEKVSLHHVLSVYGKRLFDSYL